MTDTTPAPMCSMPGCDDPRHADGLCLDHWQQFNGPSDAAPVTALAAAPAVAAPTGRLRLTPLHAVVRVRIHHEDREVLGVYGVYGTPELAQGAADMLASLGLPDEMETVPFYEVTP